MARIFGAPDTVPAGNPDNKVSNLLYLLLNSTKNGNLDLNNVLNLGTSCCAILLKNLLQKKDKKKLKKRKKILVN